MADQKFRTFFISIVPETNYFSGDIEDVLEDLRAEYLPELKDGEGLTIIRKDLTEKEFDDLPEE